MIRRLSADLGNYGKAIDGRLHQMAVSHTMPRIWEHDHRVWKESPREISDRLGWLHSPADMRERLAEIDVLVEGARKEGCRQALLLGMGGSSLAPEVFRKIFGVKEGFLDLAVLDSTDPAAVLDRAENLDPAKTLFIVSTKSGGTVETFSFLKYFFRLAADVLGKERAGQHFVAITDPGSALEEIAAAHRFRATLLNDPHIGGRYSALSFFGLAPAALTGLDIHKLIARASETAGEEADGREAPTDGAYLGAIMGELAVAGRNKATFIIPPSLAPFGVWLEQLIAESTGKEGRGIVPVIDEPPMSAAAYGRDRFFVHMRLKDEPGSESFLEGLAKAGHPLVSLLLNDRWDLGAHCFIWEMATAVAGSCLGINPFDQPDVERSKQLARSTVARYREEGALPEEAPTLQDDAVAVYGGPAAANPAAALASFIKGAGPGSYVGIQAYIRPDPQNDVALTKLRRKIGEITGLAATVGYGPRFLHSTGQLHKGDAGRGMFIQITADDVRDVPIPDEIGSVGSSLSFGVLKAAQALGDRQALLAAGRRVIRFHLGRDTAGGLRKLNGYLEGT